MAGLGSTAKAPSLPPPRPKSPPEYPDLYGKRRELAKVQMLEREIRFLEDELKFVEGLQPASRSCKDVADYVTANSDPLMPATKRVHRSCCFWKWLWPNMCIKVHFPLCTVDHHASAFHGFAVKAVSLILRCRAAVVVVTCVIVVYHRRAHHPAHPSDVQNPSATVAPAPASVPSALESPHAA
ncbi:guanine nucleotide-binding protein subunit gamma 3 [Coffea eugenioides]|uniref:guanine nucleotide-binding protein subunit gamma 3 n=1 Tax=Coffea eugenioides TaxID=49369 RepID=UPI000F6091E8|nr:guanine nucleotide-binding protein subunit gamma 3 [Coffea eugenioides]